MYDQKSQFYSHPKFSSPNPGSVTLASMHHEPSAPSLRHLSHTPQMQSVPFYKPQNMMDERDFFR